MRRPKVMCVVAALCAAVTATSLAAPSIYLDADTPATGSLLETTPLVTPYGTITFAGQISISSDPDTTAAGASGDAFDIPAPDGPQWAELYFDFDVLSATFLYGGNDGDILIEARDIGGAVVDSFYQASTVGGQPAGPLTLSGTGIRSLYWADTVYGMNYAILDNINLRVIPAPGAILLGGIGASIVGWLRRRRAL